MGGAAFGVRGEARSVLVLTADYHSSSSDGVAFHVTRSTPPRLFLISSTDYSALVSVVVTFCDSICNARNSDIDRYFYVRLLCKQIELFGKISLTGYVNFRFFFK